MRLKHKKLLISGIAVATAVALAAGALLQSGVSVLASPVMMPGIEKIVNETTAAAPFRILEIVDSKQEAEIGYYVSGQEPHIKLYEYQVKDNDGNVTNTIHFSTLEEGLSKLPAQQRKEFAENVKLNEDGSIQERGATAKDIFDVCFQANSMENENKLEDYPLSYALYEELFFGAKEEDGWKRINFTDLNGEPRIDEVELWGKYVENTAGTGDYTKQEQHYYPIRKDVEKDKEHELFRENILNFFYSEGSGATAPYYLKFEEVRNEDVNDALKKLEEGNQADNLVLQEYDYKSGRYGYYENVYANLTEELIENLTKVPGENPDYAGDGVSIQTNISLNTAEIFAADDDSPFSSNQKEASDKNSEEQPVIEEVFDAPDAFSDGGFGDGFSDAFSDMEGVPEIPQEPVTEPEPTVEVEQPDGDETADAPVDSDQREILIPTEVVGDAEVGSQKDPYIYCGETIEEYPNYRYQRVSNLLTILQKAQDSAKEDEASINAGAPIVRNSGDITLENGQYYYWYQREGMLDIEKLPLSVVVGRQPVALKNVRPIKIDEEGLSYNYYYRVSEVDFCCQLFNKVTEENPEINPEDKPDNFEYFGWYFPSYPDKEDVYLPIVDGDNEIPTHYISDPEYKLTEGIGDHDFVPGNEGEENIEKWLVEVNHMFYRGGYKSHDWLKRYVFHLNPEDEEFANFGIDVTTMTVEGFETKLSSDSAVAAGFSDFSDESVQAAFDSGSSEIERQDVGISDTELSAEEFVDFPAEPLPEEGEVSPVEMMISEGQESAETVELFLDDAALESVDEEAVFSDEEAFSTEMEEMEADPVIEDAFTSELPSAFADGEEPSEIPALEDFDLIYINGTFAPTESGVRAPAAKMLAASRIPCIVNQGKTGKDSEIYRAFADENLVKEDIDGHFVNRHVYFFINTLLSEENADEKFDFISQLFHATFYLEPEDEDLGDGVLGEAKEGFEEILEYIKQENQYRGLGKKDEITDGSALDKGYLLTTELSQARAVEYILNYKHKRVIVNKKTINVLEIQPAKSDGQISENDILRWLGYEPLEEKVTACCEERIGENNGNLGHVFQMTDDKDETYWHSAYRNDNKDFHMEKSPHWIQIEYNRPVTFTGIHYTKRPGSINGDIYDFKVTCYGDKDNVIKEDESGWSENDGQHKLYIADEEVSGVKKIVVDIKAAGQDGTADGTIKFASCAELQVDIADEDSIEYPKVNITTMTSSEYVGHIDDINDKYDMIYLGDDETHLNDYVNFRPDSFLYYHVGRAVQAKLELQGLMNQDYKETDDGQKTLATIQDNVGLVRGSGNDITEQQKRELLDFVKSGYPLILGDMLLENKLVDTNRVDNSSYVYQFLQEAIGFSNCMTKAEAVKNSSLSFYLNVPKPVIDLQESPASAIGNENGPSENYLTGEGLNYKFSIINDAENSPANARYNCELYLDLNCDGNFSPSTERMADIQVRDENGMLIGRNAEGKYELQIDRMYSVSRTIPIEYAKLITWKLEVSNNQNDYIRTSVHGYTKRKGDSENIPEIKVLQLRPEGGACTWDLTTEKFQKLFEPVSDEFKITIHAVTVPFYNEHYDPETGNLGTDFNGGEENLKQDYDNLESYDMLIMGFGDSKAYGDVKENGVAGIQKFIDSGKSVIFAHDTTSSYVTNDGVNNSDWQTSFIWGYNFTSKMRSVMGMDRYGIAENKDGSETEVSVILKRAQRIDTQSDDWNTILENVPDMAYETGNGRTSAYPETHGFSNSKLRIATKDRDGTRADIQNRVTNVNEGAITEYPYKIPDETGFQIASTHGQYYQAALENDADKDKRNDIVVWYCLDGGTYADSPNDVRNNYYIFSNRNIYYTGVGHHDVEDNKDENKVLIETEMKLFVNTIVAAYRASAVNPLVDFVDSFDMDAEEQESLYYMTDQLVYDRAAGNILNEGQEFYFRVKDNNLISTGVEEAGERQMKVEFFITPSIGQGEEISGINERVNPLRDIRIFNKDGKITETVSSGNVYRFQLNEMYQYLMDENNNYLNNIRLYVKISTTYMYFGKEIDVSAVDSITLRQRQLFDLD